ncbi:unnamed protein product [Leuciscus chuanchicus]
MRGSIADRVTGQLDTLPGHGSLRSRARASPQSCSRFQRAEDEFCSYIKNRACTVVRDCSVLRMSFALCLAPPSLECF